MYLRIDQNPYICMYLRIGKHLPLLWEGGSGCTILSTVYRALPELLTLIKGMAAATRSVSCTLVTWLLHLAGRRGRGEGRGMAGEMGDRDGNDY